MPQPPIADRYDLVVVGSGIAGLYAALQAHERGAQALVVTKAAVDEASTRYAQGGISAAIGPHDSSEIHLRDTIEAGAGLVDEEAARVLVEAAADRIADLVRYGVRFDEAEGEVALSREAAHSQRRILHARGDQTGLEIELSLSSLAQREGITVLEHALADRILVEDGQAAGVEILHVNGSGDLERTAVAAPRVVLATGGVGQMYRITSNPPVSTGDGIALAYEAGAEVMDMEFTQFHPTVLRVPGRPTFLISEAVRGEGAKLLNAEGERFMLALDERAELAPRYVVAYAELLEMRRSGQDHVWLDITDHDETWLAARFPNIYRTCLDGGLDMSRDRIPVSPAAHYTMGGVRTNTWGETTLPGLFAVGEVACTGVHGANRLASNSLLETVVFAKRAVQRLFDDAPRAGPPSATADARTLSPIDAQAMGEPPTTDDVRALMWEQVGIERHGEGLADAAQRLAEWATTLAAASDRASAELHSILTCSRLAAEAALLREESRGAHQRIDFPQPREEWRRHIVFRADA